MRRGTLDEIQDQLSVRRKYEFQSMAVNDTLVFHAFDEAESARVAALQFTKRRDLSWKFSLRKITTGWVLIRVT